MFAGGAIIFDLQSRNLPGWSRSVWPLLILTSGIVIAPNAIPVLPPEAYIRYAKALHIGQPAIERHKLGPLPQIFADQFGDSTATRAKA